MTPITFGSDYTLDVYTERTSENNIPSVERKKNNKKKESVLARFCEDFSYELDIFDSWLEIPDWVFSLRETQILKISPAMRKICRRLKEIGLDFKIKWPVEIDGKWKFADVLFPRQRTVLIVTNAMALLGRPHWMLSDRAEMFRSLFRVVEVETLADLDRKIRLKAKERAISQVPRVNEIVVNSLNYSG